MCRQLYQDGVLEVYVKGYGKRVGLINCPYFLVSLTGNNYLAQDINAEMVILYSINSSKEVVLSFRSIPGFDCSIYAKAEGGGGHKNAAGATVTMERFMELLNSGKDTNNEP